MPEEKERLIHVEGRKRGMREKVSVVYRDHLELKMHRRGVKPSNEEAAKKRSARRGNTREKAKRGQEALPPNFNVWTDPPHLREHLEPRSAQRWVLHSAQRSGPPSWVYLSVRASARTLA